MIMLKLAIATVATGIAGATLVVLAPDLAADLALAALVFLG